LRVHEAFRQLRESRVSGPFFVERLLQQLGCVGVPEQFGVGTRRAIVRDFEMFDALRRRDEPRIPYVAIM
jgi:hypothetical protein